MKPVILEALIATSKCIYISAMTILSSDSTHLYSTSLKSEKNRKVLHQRRAQIQNLSEFIDSLIQNKCATDMAMSQKMEEIGTLMRLIKIEI